MSTRSRLRRAIADRVLRAPRWLRRVAPAPPTVRGQTPDPELWWLVWLTSRMEPKNPEPDALRREYAFGSSLFDAPPPEGVTHRDDVVPRRDGGALPVRVYTPDVASPLPGVVYFHGGGYVIGDLDSHHSLCARLARDAAAVVIAVDYRLAPEHPFPTPWDDGEDAWAAIAADPGRFGVGGPLAVGGDSAGANLAIWVARSARVAPSHLWALYPPTDAGGSYPSNDDFGEGLFLTERRKRWFRDQTYPDPAQLVDPRARPLREPARRADGSAVPTTVIVAGMDVLRDEGEAYIRHLERERVPVRGLVIQGQVHGFASLCRVPSCARAWAESVAPLRAALSGRAGR